MLYLLGLAGLATARGRPAGGRPGQDDDSKICIEHWTKIGLAEAEAWEGKAPSIKLTGQLHVL